MVRVADSQVRDRFGQLERGRFGFELPVRLGRGAVQDIVEPFPAADDDLVAFTPFPQFRSRVRVQGGIARDAVGVHGFERGEGAVGGRGDGRGFGMSFGERVEEAAVSADDVHDDAVRLRVEVSHLCSKKIAHV